MSDLTEDLVKTMERSASAGPVVFRQRVWGVMAKHGLTDEISKIVGQIRQDIEAERKRGKGKQRRTEYNEPPAALKRQFESVHKETIVAGSKHAPATVRHELQGPIERYKSDMTGEELAALVRAVETGVAACRQPGVTASYGEGLGGGGRRDGGVNDRHRLAYTTHMHTLSQIPKDWWPILHGLIEGGLNVMEIGKVLLPQHGPNKVADERVLRGAGRAFVKLLAQSLLKLEIERRGLERGEKRDRNVIDQIRRERAARREAAE